MAELNVVVCIAFDHRADALGLERFKGCIARCAFVDVAMEVTGTFDMIVQGKIGTLAGYTDQMDRIRPQLTQFVSRIETNFVGKKIERRSTAENSMWLPCTGGRRRIDIGMINKVVAEGDYMRLFVRDWHCLVHSTIRALREQLDDRFVQLHRSSIVRTDFIDRLMHRDHRWTARLQDGSHLSVARSHVPEVLKLMSGDSSDARFGLAKAGAAAETVHPLDESDMRAAR